MKFFRFFSLVLALYAVFMTTACPPASLKTVQKAYKASEKLGNYTQIAAVNIGDLYTAGFIDYATKERIISKLRIVGQNGVKFHNTIKSLADKYKDGLPAGEVTNLDLIFSTEVIKYFFDILNEIGALSKERAGMVYAAIVMIRNAVMLISGTFGSGTASNDFYLKQKEVNASG